jgi:pyrroloquinoline quinone biosynthesis protein D
MPEPTETEADKPAARGKPTQAAKLATETRASLDLDDKIEINPMYVFRWEESQDAYLMLYPEGVVKLNETAGEILKRCAGEMSANDIVHEFEGLYVGDDVANGVRSLLEDSYAKGWIRSKSE